MVEKLQTKIQNLELLLHLKSIILKATDINTFLLDVCNSITQLHVYDVSWVVLVDEKHASVQKYCSLESIDLDNEYLCWKEAVESPDVYIHQRNSKRCVNCILSANDDASLISKRMEYGGVIYGVFSVSIMNCLLADDVKQQFSDLVDDISRAIYSLKLKSESDQYQIELSESRNMYRKLLETSSILVGTMDLDFRLLFMSNSLKKLMGYSIDEESAIVGRAKGTDFLPKDFKTVAAPILAEVLEKNVIRVVDVVLNSIDGKQMQMRLRISLMRNNAGKPKGYMVVFHDLSAEIKTKEDILMSEEKFRLLFMKAPNGISLLSPSGVILDCNERDAEMLQYSRSEMIGKHIKGFLTEEYKSSFIKNFKDFRSVGCKSLTLKLKRKDGIVLTVLRNVSAFNNSDGSLRGIIVHSRDVSGEIEAQQKIKLLSSAIEQSSSVFTITDLDGKITYVNNKFEEVTGWSFNEVIGRNPNILKSGNLPDTLYKDMWQKLKSGQVWKGELSNIRKDGTQYWEYASMSSIRDDEGKITNMLKVAEDITIRRETKKKLKEATIRYHNIFNTAPNPIVIHVNGVIVDLNRAALLFSEAKSREALIGQSIMGFIHESSRKEIMNQIRVLNRGAKILPFEATFVNVRGEKRNVRTASNIISFEGEQAYMIFFEDITERKKAEKKLIESEKRFRNFFNIIPDPVIITNYEKGSFVEVNDAALIMGNKSHNEVIGNKSFTKSLYHNIEDRETMMNQLFMQGYILNEELEIVLNNKKLTVLVSGRTIEPVEEKNVLFVAHDITERKMMEQELVDAKEKAEAGEVLKSSFLSNMSHEVRTPMNAILGFSDLLRDSEMDDNQRNQYVDIIQQRGNDLLKMISDIMDISKIESGSLEIVHHAVKIKSLIREAVEASQLRIEKDVTKKVILTSNCKISDDALVGGDKYRIRQILNNLLDNAIKFTKEGTIELRCWKENENIMFELEDTGCGIAPEKLDIVFHRFVQVHDIKDVSIGGSGLGLSISKSLVELIGGKISVESKYGKGSKFSFSFKVFDGMGVSSEELTPSVDAKRNWSGKTILIAEDDPSNQLFINVILTITKVKIIMANDGEEAIQLFNTHRDSIDLVIVDVKMPRINGYQLTQYIKEHKPELPVIALTANAMNNDREEALKNGCDDYLSKPIAKELLYNTIERYLF